MDQEVLRNWVVALRSGKYQQSQGGLHNADGFCCLGVLCDLHREQFPTHSWTHGGIGPFVYGNQVEESRSDFPPRSVIDWANLELKSHGKVANLNDAGASFEAIADFIEANFQ